jgi:hypothetical protein
MTEMTERNPDPMTTPNDPSETKVTPTPAPAEPMAPTPGQPATPPAAANATPPPTWQPTTPAPTQPVSPTPIQPVTPAAASAPPASPAAPVQVAGPTRRTSSRWLNVLLGVATAVAIAGVAFAVGRTTAPAQAATSTLPGFVTDGIGPKGSFAPGQGGGPVFSASGGLTLSGTVKSIDATTLVLTTADGQDITINLDSSTTYKTATAASQSDVAVGDQVDVRVNGGRSGRIGTGGGNGNSNGNGTSELKAGDVTVVR